jgi:hypothetical protein
VLKENYGNGLSFSPRNRNDTWWNSGNLLLPGQMVRKKIWTETDKEVNNALWQSSELKKNYEAQGFIDFSWSNSNRVAERILEGKEIVYETDEQKLIKTKLVNKSGQILLCRKRV